MTKKEIKTKLAQMHNAFMNEVVKGERQLRDCQIIDAVAVNFGISAAAFGKAKMEARSSK